MSMLRGVGRPAAAILALVECLSRAASTASGALPGRPNASAILETRGTAISQKVHTPSSSPKSCMHALQHVVQGRPVGGGRGGEGGGGGGRGGEVDGGDRRRC